MTPTPHLRRRGLLAAALLAGALSTGCSGSDEPAATAGSPSAGASSGASSGVGGGAGGGTSPGATGQDQDAPSDHAGGSEPSGAPSGAGQGAGVDATSPFVVAATAVARRSLDQVLQLHALGVTTAGQGDLPADQVAALARAIRRELGVQIQDTTRLPPPKDSPAAALASALADYQALAEELSGWQAGAGAMPPEWFDRLGTADRSWRKSLRRLGRLARQDLLADQPELLMPS